MFPITRLLNGVHSIRVVAFEAYGAASEFTAPLRIDNTVPAPPSSITVKGRSAWRAYPTGEATWKDPPQTLAPITAVRYALCPSESTSDPTSSARSRTGADRASGPRRTLWNSRPRSQSRDPDSGPEAVADRRCAQYQP